MSKKSTYEELEQRVKELEKDADRLKQTEEILKEERDKFEQYLAIAGFIVVVLDSNQEVVLINKKGCEILERKEEEVIGKNWYDNFVPEKIREGVRPSPMEMSSPFKTRYLIGTLIGEIFLGGLLRLRVSLKIFIFSSP